MGKFFRRNHLKDINSPRRHEVHEEKPKQNLRVLRVLRVFVVKCLKLMSMRISPYRPNFEGGVEALSRITVRKPICEMGRLAS